METVKSAVGLGKSKEQDEEPVSGETGTGTTAEPYDAGNSSEAQEAAKEKPEQQDNEDTTGQDTSERKTQLGSSWLQSAIPFSNKKSKDSSDEQTSAGAPNDTPDQPKEAEDEPNRPPNHLGVNVPEGHSLDFAPPQPEQLSPAEAKKQEKMPEEENSTVASASAEGADDTQPTPRSPSSPSASKPSPAQLRGSRASIAPPPGKRVFNPSGENPGRIPTAGGRVLGEAASEDRRRRSVWSSSSETNTMPPLDKQGSPDPVTQSNTVSNTVPQSPNGEGSSKSAVDSATAAPPPAKEGKPEFNFAWGEGGEGAAEGSKAGTSTKTDDSSATPSKAEQVKESTTSGGGNNETPTKERRASRFGRFKEKMGMSK
ncbi:uncharacterized protein LTR77_007494 [Saxophila tyrrhenica]|uniref:Uncharacterized protein n=1 Tax=Saxophila tyrrhenica TaxID=1690608 RepID=A0AAV9P8V1_9PEZI|nr:hypothetical protein LTR77_007494 [Saxophila tyrrhenica]